MQSIAILGRQPAISLAELEALFTADKITCLNDSSALLDVPVSEIPFARLGGTIKLAEVLGSANAKDIRNYLGKLVRDLPLSKQGKINLGLSSYGFTTNPKVINDLALSLKGQMKAHGYKVRVVPNRTVSLNTAQVWYNRLIGNSGLELLLVASADKVFVARTVDVQDINDYTIRDRGRPKRDTHVGMLPPKLAQIIINLASGDTKPDNKILMDPFCGTGVILQEALLMGFEAIGSDIDPRMVDFSTINLDWLRHEYPRFSFKSEVILGDARIFKWPKRPDTLASETLLGPVFDQPPDDNRLTILISELNILHKKFLVNLHGQLATGSRLCLAVPAWRSKNQFRHLPVLDQLADLGYNRVAFKHADCGQLIYYRPDQMVARELVILIRK
jgi:hypothetical protein